MFLKQNMRVRIRQKISTTMLSTQIMILSEMTMVDGILYATFLISIKIITTILTNYEKNVLMTQLEKHFIIS